MIGRADKRKSVPTLRGMLARGHMRMVLLAVLLATLSLMISGVIALRSYAAKNVDLAAETLSYTIEPALVFQDAAAAREIALRLGESNNLARIAITDAQGKPFVSWQRPEHISDAAGARAAAWLGLGPVQRQITFRGEVVGSVQATGSINAIFQYAFAALVIALCCLGVTIIATRMLARRLEESIAVPLDRIVDIAHDLVSQRRLSGRLEPAGIVEIDKFTNCFNVLLEELESWNETLTNENAELMRRADRDPLTGLGNRTWFERMLREAIARAEAERSQFVLLFCDCDGFKQINDNYGHETGDAIICMVADRLQLAASEADRVFRLGGDEFAIVLETGGSDLAMQRVKERVRSVMQAPLTIALKVEHKITISIGHATYPADGQTARQLVRVADRRMYSEKRGDFAQ